MTRGAFGQPNEGAPLDPSDLYDLIGLAYENDIDAIREWALPRLTSRQAHIQFVFTVLGFCSSVMKVSLKAGAKGFAVLEVAPDASRAHKIFGRMLTATLNEDEQILQALMKALIEHTETTGDETDLGFVEAQSMHLLHYLLHQAAELKKANS